MTVSCEEETIKVPVGVGVSCCILKQVTLSS